MYETITTKMLSEIRRLNEADMNDTRISEILGLKYGTVRYHRKKMGLPTRTRGYRFDHYKRYSVYDGRTSEFIIEGTAAQCAARINISIGAFYSAVTHYKQGLYSKYEFHVEEPPKRPKQRAS